MSEQTIIDIAGQARLALEGCTRHVAGTVRALDRALQAVRDGDLEPGDLRRVGERIIDGARARIAEADGRPDVAERERLVIDAATAMFCSLPPAPIALRPVGIVGKGRRCPPELCTLAEDAGLALARWRSQLCLITGGLAGVMHHAAHGFARRGGGVAVGLLPTRSGVPRSPSLTVALDTGLTEAVRNVVIGSCVELLVVLPGSHGTAQEAVVALDRGVPCLFVGDHEGWLTEWLHHGRTDAEDLADVVGDLLSLPA